MTLTKSGEYALEKLFELGVFSTDGLEQLGNMLSLLEELDAFKQRLIGANANAGGVSARMTATQKQPRKTRVKKPAPKKVAETSEASTNGRRGRKSKVEINRQDLVELMDAGMTGKQIAERFGVSAATINNKKRDFGLTSTRRGRKPKGATANQPKSPGQKFQEENFPS